MSQATDFLSQAEQEEVVKAIKEAELNTSGEIRLHIENQCPEEDAFDRALEVFQELDMHNTELQNGVLMYLAVDDHQFVIVGDKGINDIVGNNFWESTKDKVISNFKKDQFKEGLVQGILEAGEQLKKHFPHQSDDKNELSDDISHG